MLILLITGVLSIIPDCPFLISRILFEMRHVFSFLYLFLSIPLFPSVAIILVLFLVMANLFCESDATWAPLYSAAPFVLFIWQTSPRIVLGYQRSPADRVTACVRLWPISGFTLNLILIITSVINRQGLGGDYSGRPVPLFPLSTVLTTRPRAVIPVLIWGRQILDSVPLKIWWL